MHNILCSFCKYFYFSGYDVIARHLARIDKRLDDIESILGEIKNNYVPSTSNEYVLPSELKLPCSTLSEVNKIEEWLCLNEDNEVKLVRQATDLYFFFISMHFDSICGVSGCISYNLLIYETCSTTN